MFTLNQRVTIVAKNGAESTPGRIVGFESETRAIVRTIDLGANRQDTRVKRQIVHTTWLRVANVTTNAPKASA